VQEAVLIITAFLVAAFGSIIGAGGGFLLMPVLLLMYPGDPQQKLTFISLFAVLVNAVTAAFNYARQGRIDYRSALLLGVCTIPTSILARLAGDHVDRRHFSAIFAGVLMAIALFILWRVRRTGETGWHQTPIRPGWWRRQITDASGATFTYGYNVRTGIGVSLVEGFIASFFGIGGGILHMPVMTQLLHFPPHIAAATSILVLATGALAAVATDVVRHGTDLPIALALLAGVGGFLGAQVGTRIARRITGRKLLYLLAIALAAAGVRLFFQKAPPTAPPRPDRADPICRSQVTPRRRGCYDTFVRPRTAAPARRPTPFGSRLERSREEGCCPATV